MDTFTYLGSTKLKSSFLNAKKSALGVPEPSLLMAKLKRVWSDDLVSERTKMCACVKLVYCRLCFMVVSRGQLMPDKSHDSADSTSAAFGACIMSQDKIPNTEVLICTNLISLPSLLIQRYFCWLGHVQCMEPGFLLREILHRELQECTWHTG